MKPGNQRVEEEQVKYLSFVRDIRSNLLPCQQEIIHFRNATAETYKQIAEKLPQLMETIDAANERERANIESVVSQDEVQSGNTLVGQALSETRENIVKVANSFREMFRLDQAIFKNIKSQMDQLEALRSAISRIALISDDIELLSYNSVFVASQAGQHGAAFTHIAKEIKVLSNKTSRIVKQMTESSNRLVRSYTSFNEEIEKVNTATSNRLENIDSELARIFDKCNSGLRNVATLVFQLIERSAHSKNHVQEIMLALQAQDLIWQLLEEVSHLNDEIIVQMAEHLHEQWGNAHEDEEFMAIIEENSARTHAILHMATTILNTVVEKMNAAADTLEELLNKLQDELKDIKSDMESMINFFAHGQESLHGRSSIQVFFDESVEFTQDVLTFVKTSIGQKNEIGQFSDTLKKNLKQIEFDFNAMNDIVRQFSIIKVVSKMEITREVALSSNMTGSNEMFERLTQEIENEVSSLGAQIAIIHSNTVASLDQLSDHLDLQEQSIHQIDQTVSSSIAGLKRSSNSSTEAVRQIGKGSEQVFHLIAESFAGLQTIRNHIRSSRAISQRYKSILARLQDYRKQKQLDYPEMFSKGTEHTRFEDLARIAGKFSVYLQKEQNEGTIAEPGLASDVVLF